MLASEAVLRPENFSRTLSLPSNAADFILLSDAILGAPLLSVAEDAGDGGQRERRGGRGAIIGAMLRGIRGVQHGAVLGGDELHGLKGGHPGRGKFVFSFCAKALCNGNAPVG